MKLTDLYASQLEREAKVTRRAVEAVPEGRGDYKPHEKSMPLGTLANLVGTMPSWIAMIVGMDELDIAPAGGGEKPKTPSTRKELLTAHDDAVVKARAALRGTNDEHLAKPWKLLAGGKLVMEQPRHVVIEDTFAHLAHHRGQLTVYLRMNGAPVPAIYGPTADDNRFD